MVRRKCQVLVRKMRDVLSLVEAFRGDFELFFVGIRYVTLCYLNLHEVLAHGSAIEGSANTVACRKLRDLHFNPLVHGKHACTRESPNCSFRILASYSTALLSSFFPSTWSHLRCCAPTLPFVSTLWNARVSNSRLFRPGRAPLAHLPSRVPIG